MECSGEKDSKFVILLEYENPCRFFRFSFHATLFFPLMNALVYVEMKNEKNYMGFRIPKIWQILKRFAGTFHQA